MADKALIKDQLQALQALRKAWGDPAFCAAMFWLLTKQDEVAIGDLKEEPSKLVPFNFNPIQLDLHKNLAQNNLLLKARQMGGTTFFLLVRGLLNVITHEGENALLVSQSDKYVQKHLMIAHRATKMFGMRNPHNDAENQVNLSFREHLLHTKYLNKQELYFDNLDAHMAVASAEVEESAQGFTLHHIVASEYSRWPGHPEATMANIRGALVTGGTCDVECTANGAVGSFYKEFLLAKTNPELSDAKAHFYPWYLSDEYRLDLTRKQEKELKDDLAEDEKKVIDAFHLDLKQVAWRRAAKKAFPGVEFQEKYPEDWLTAFTVSGQSYFDRDILVARKLELINYKPFQSFHNGQAKFFHKRIPGRRYVIGADPATGRQVEERVTDNSAAVVIDLEDGEEVAAYRAHVAPDEFAFDLADLGNYYNSAPILVERTGDGGSVILVLAGECRYPAIMKTKEWLKREKKTVEFDGFPTNVRTRPIALNFLNRQVKEHPELIWDMDFIDEALVFVRDEKGKPCASPGAHDDTVSARWIAHAGRQMLLGYWLQEGSEKYLASDRL